VADLDTVDHVALEAADVGAAVDWYRERFNCEIVHQDPTWAMVRFANISLAIVTPGQHPPHFAIARSDAADFGELVEHRDGVRTVYITDSAGNSVEIVER
jgi:catechol 2,3-dioxygenase-like lactoylglutathione lyase family enzyme